MQRAFFSRDCSAVAPLLWEYAAGSLEASGTVAARVEGHLARCPRCRVRLESCRMAARALTEHAAAPPGGIPDRTGDWGALRARIAADAPVRTQQLRPLLAGMLALAAGMAVCAVGIPQARQRDLERRTTIVSLAALAPSQQREAADTGADSGVTFGRMKASSLFSDADAPVEMVALSCWNSTVGQSHPLAVFVRNRTGRALSANLVVKHRVAGDVRRRYLRQIALPADTDIHRFFVYPSSADSQSAFDVSLFGSFPTQETTVNCDSWQFFGASIGLVASRFGELEPIRRWNAEDITGRDRMQRSMPAFYVAPDLAPDRPSGYDELRTLVLGREAQQLAPPQWEAIRKWVIGGGSLIVLPGVGSMPPGMSMGAAPESVSAPKAAPLWGKAVRRWQLGLGTVLTLDFDPTEREYRARQDLPKLWMALAKAAAPVVRADGLRRTALSPRQDWAPQTETDASGDERFLSAKDPFMVSLPPVQSVVYLFLTYFVLTVPVTFVVLRHTRRLNWAWATGPTLAALFGGAVYAFTTELYAASLSRRTTGTLVAAAGDGHARFDGYTELYFPHGGSYDVTIPGAEKMDLDTSYDSGTSGGMAVRSLDTVETDTGLVAPAFGVGNLSFRRLYHTQTVDWGSGITARLRLTGGGALVGELRNDTGQAIDNAEIVLPVAEGARLGWAPRLQYSVSLGRIVPGITPIDRRVAWGNKTRLSALQAYTSDQAGGPGGQEDQSFRVPQTAPSAPVLIGDLSGETFGPRLGRWVGGGDTVRMVVGLSALEAPGRVSFQPPAPPPPDVPIAVNAGPLAKEVRP